MLDEETKKYVDSFYESPFSAYDFMVLFSTINVIKGVHVFNRNNLLNYIVQQKQQRKYETILRDIHLKSNGVFYYSNDLDEAISFLKIAGVLYTVSPENDSSVFISDTLDISEMIKPRVEYMTSLVEFINDYEKDEIKKISDVHNQIYNQENIENEIAALRLRQKSSKK